MGSANRKLQEVLHPRLTCPIEGGVRSGD